jgi:hypothetical protein
MVAYAATLEQTIGFFALVILSGRWQGSCRSRKA